MAAQLDFNGAASGAAPQHDMPGAELQLTLAWCEQDGVELGDVVLPPWAGGSPEECIRLHREALEGEVLPQQLFPCLFGG